MTCDRPSLRHATPAGRPWRRRSGAFTLVELLIVIGIIAVLASILIPTITSIVKSGKRSAQRQALAGIERALDAYQGDHNDIPRFSDAGGAFNNAANTSDRGARLLARALFGPAEANDGTYTAAAWLTTSSGDKADTFQDGVDGFGFKAQRQVVPDGSGGETFYLPGESYGPYLEPDRWDLGDDDTDDTTFTAATVILDANGLPILYYPARRDAPTARFGPAQSGTYVGAVPVASANPAVLFNSDDNRMFPGTVASAKLAANLPAGYTAADADALSFFRKRVGDVNENGAINGDEVAVDRAYLLIASGPDSNARGSLPDPTAGYADFLKAAGWEYGRDAVTNFDE